MSYNLTDEQVMTALGNVVAENPDKVYKLPKRMEIFDGDTSCYYVHTKEDGSQEAGCIVGQVLHRLGVPLEDLKASEGWRSNHVIERLEIQGLSERVTELLRRIQIEQDKGWSWGRAYAAETKNSVPALEKA
ncbi:hypothetical protein ACIBAH_35055 [Streptomyces sp. NPDC051445]|uniref:hypothetical protein n=1 Tax=Streptomyces sp. NPDC051445 TaxID=3365653 RepID=UPI00379CFBF0